MDKRETVIYSIERCICHVPDACRDCAYNSGHPYNECVEMLLRDALELLKVQELQEPRLITLDEVGTAENCMEPVFVEMLDENGKPQDTPDLFSWRFVKHITTFSDGKIYVFENMGFSSALWEETYGITWRCWTARPTYAQREAVKWIE